MPLSPSKVLKIWRRDGFKCVECSATENLTIDHITPRVRGGGDEEENLRTLCKHCNSAKSAKDRLTHRDGASNMGVPRELVAFRLHQDALDFIDVRAADQHVNRSQMMRRMLAYASAHMPETWKPRS